VTWIVLGAVVVAVLLGLALVWRQLDEMERGEGTRALTRQRTLIGWVLLVLGNALRWLVFSQ
jgi:hypothetical protein